ncbi:MAG TPA: ABC transporter substrate-binding protein [Nitrospiraceae bacterium]|nr:ABC transporter substrate-binding protein [Nitrospiraceae bacterium]
MHLSTQLSEPMRSGHHPTPLPGMTPSRATVLTAALAIGIAWMVACPGIGQAESPTEAVRNTINQMIKILDNADLKTPNKAQERRRNLELIVARRFDYAEMSKRTLAAQWRSLPQQERDEFVDLFKSFLSDRYAGKIEGYAGEQVQYLSERIEGEYAEVRTKLVSQKVTIPIDYRLIKRGEEWHAYDIVVDGVSLVKNYRSQFSKILRDSSYSELVRRLRDRAIGEEKDAAESGRAKK